MSFQSKEHGTVGALGVPVQPHVIARELGADQEHILATCHALAVILLQIAVMVIHQEFTEVC